MMKTKREGFFCSSERILKNVEKECSYKLTAIAVIFPKELVFAAYLLLHTKTSKKMTYVFFLTSIQRRIISEMQ